MDETKRQKTSFKVRHTPDHDTAALILKSEMTPADTLLIKGSRGLRMEKVWETLTIEPARQG